MAYSLNQLADFVLDQRTAFEEKIKEEAKRLTCSELVESFDDLTELGRRIAQRRSYAFERGQELVLVSPPFGIRLWQDKLQLKYDQTDLREFSGDPVQKFYSSLATYIEEEIKKHWDDIPF